MSAIFTGADFSAPVTHIGLYSDNTPMVKLDQWDEIVAKADTLTLQADSLQQFVVGMFLVDSVRESGGRIDNLILPYLPGARQDRVNPTGDVLFTAHSVAIMINAMRFKRVVSIDPHSQAMPAVINGFVNYPLSLVANKMWQGYTGIIAADKGGRNRAEQFANAMNKPIFYGSKVRDVSNGRLTGFDLEPLPEGGHFLVVDDICDGGGTFLGLGEKIAEQGCYADLYVTHGIFAKGTDALRRMYKNVITTDSFPTYDRNGLTIIKVVEDMEKY